MKRIAHGNFCANCGRLLKSEGTRIYPLGTLGPECAQKFAGLKQVLGTLGIGELELGGMVVALERTDDGWALPGWLIEAQERCQKAGLKIGMRVRVYNGAVVADCWLQLASPSRLEAACGSYSEFAAGVRGRALEREEAAAWAERGIHEVRASA